MDLSIDLPGLTVPDLGSYDHVVVSTSAGKDSQADLGRVERRMGHRFRNDLSMAEIAALADRTEPSRRSNRGPADAVARPRRTCRIRIDRSIETHRAAPEAGRARPSPQRTVK